MATGNPVKILVLHDSEGLRTETMGVQPIQDQFPESVAAAPS